jgi:hypothetical protein
LIILAATLIVFVASIVLTLLADLAGWTRDILSATGLFDASAWWREVLLWGAEPLFAVLAVLILWVVLRVSMGSPIGILIDKSPRGIIKGEFQTRDLGFRDRFWIWAIRWTMCRSNVDVSDPFGLLLVLAWLGVVLGWAGFTAALILGSPLPGVDRPLLPTALTLLTIGLAAGRRQRSAFLTRHDPSASDPEAVPLVPTTGHVRNVLNATRNKVEDIANEEGLPTKDRHE